MWRYLLPLGLFGVLVAFFWIGLGLDPGEVPSPLIGKPAPEFELPRLDDSSATVGTRDWKDQVVLFNVWGTWCVGCRQEHDTLLAIADSGIVPIYGLDWKDEPARAKQWLTQLGDPYVANAVDLDGRVAIDWGVYGAPETFLIDAEGNVIYKYIGPLSMRAWQEELLPRVLEAKEALK